MPPPVTQAISHQPQERRPSAPAGAAAMSSSATFQRLGGVMATRRVRTMTPAETIISSSSTQRPAWMDDLKRTVKQRKADGTLWQQSQESMTLSPPQSRPEFIKELKKAVPRDQQSQELAEWKMEQQKSLLVNGDDGDLPVWKRNLMLQKQQSSPKKPVNGSNNNHKIRFNLPSTEDKSQDNHDDDDDDDNSSVTDSLAGKPEFIRKQRKMNFRKEEAILEACGKLDVDAQQQINLLLRENLATKVKHYNQATNEIRIVRQTPAAYQQGLYKADGSGDQTNDDSDSETDDPEFIRAQHELKDPSQRVIYTSSLPQQQSTRATASRRPQTPPTSASKTTQQYTEQSTHSPINSPRRAQPTSYQQSLILKFRQILAGKLDEVTRTQVEALLIEALVEEAVLRDHVDDFDEEEHEPVSAMRKVVQVSTSTGSLSSLSTNKSMPQQQSSMLEQKLLAGSKQAKRQQQQVELDMDDDESLAGKPEFLRKFRKMNFAKNEHVLEASGCNFMGMSDALMDEANKITATTLAASNEAPTIASAKIVPKSVTAQPLVAKSKWTPPAKVDNKPVVTVASAPSKVQTPVAPSNGTVSASDTKPEFLRKFDKMNFKKDETVLETSGKREFMQFTSIGESITGSLTTSVSTTFVAKANAIAADYEKEIDMNDFLFNRDDMNCSSHNEAAEYIKARTLQALTEDEALDEAERKLATEQLEMLLATRSSPETKTDTIDNAKTENEPEWRLKFRQMKFRKENETLADSGTNHKSFNKNSADVKSITRRENGLQNPVKHIAPPAKPVNATVEHIMMVETTTTVAATTISSSCPSQQQSAIPSSPICQNPSLPRSLSVSDGKPEWMKKFQSMQFNKDETVLVAGGVSSSTIVDNLSVKEPASEAVSTNVEDSSTKLLHLVQKEVAVDVNNTQPHIDTIAMAGMSTGNDAQLTSNRKEDNGSREQTLMFKSDEFALPIVAEPQTTCAGQDDRPPSSNVVNVAKAPDTLVKSKPPVMSEAMELATVEINDEDDEHINERKEADNDDFFNGQAFAPELNVFESNAAVELDAFASFDDAAADFGSFGKPEAPIAVDDAIQTVNGFADLKIIDGGDKISFTAEKVDIEPRKSSPKTETPGTHLSERMKKDERVAERKNAPRSSRSVSSRKAETDKSRRRSSNGSDHRLQQEGKRERRSSRAGTESRERRMSRSGNEHSCDRMKPDVDKARRDYGKSRATSSRRLSMDDKTTCSRSSGESRTSFGSREAATDDKNRHLTRKPSASDRDSVDTRSRDDRGKGNERSDRSSKDRDDRRRRGKDDRSVRSRDEQSVKSKDSHGNSGRDSNQTSPSFRKSSRKMKRASSNGTLTGMPLVLEGPFEGSDRKQETKVGEGDTAGVNAPVEASRQKSGKMQPKDTAEFMKLLHMSVNDLSSKKKVDNHRGSRSKGVTASARTDRKKLHSKDKIADVSMPVLPMDFTEFDDNDDARGNEGTPFDDDPWEDAGGKGSGNDFDEFDFDDGFAKARDNEESETRSEGFNTLHMSATSEIFIDPSQLTRTTMTPVTKVIKVGGFDTDGFDFSPSGVSMSSDKEPPSRRVARSRSIDMSPVIADDNIVRKGRRSSGLMNSMSAFESASTAEFTVTKASARGRPDNSPGPKSDKKSRNKNRKKKETVFDTYDWTVS
ncbi:hypothetical protein MPSEU_000812100 [Mayamaea pseudoterrestris]|nr:hypothetical protein MPSEU_000812100 [Mayamaea pseudoterrestris]